MSTSKQLESGDGVDVLPPDPRLSALGFESRLPGWISRRDLRDAGSSKGTQPELNPVKTSCPGSRPSKTARLQRKTTAVTATADAMPHRRRSYEDNCVNRQSQEVARLTLADEVVEHVDDEEMADAEGASPRKADSVFAGGVGDAATMDSAQYENHAATIVNKSRTLSQQDLASITSPAISHWFSQLW